MQAAHRMPRMSPEYKCKGNYLLPLSEGSGIQIPSNTRLGFYLQLYAGLCSACRAPDYGASPSRCEPWDRQSCGSTTTGGHGSVWTRRCAGFLLLCCSPPAVVVPDMFCPSRHCLYCYANHCCIPRACCTECSPAAQHEFWKVEGCYRTP